MGRPRNRPDEGDPPAAEESAEPSGKTVSLTYNGPPDQFVGGLGFKLEPGESYDVPEEMAEGLLAGSANWEK